MTWFIVLLVLLCQFTSISAAFSVQYPHGEHPSGSQVNHHHFHQLENHASDNHSVHQHAHQSELSFNATETQQDIIESNIVSAEMNNGLADHEHSGHSHSAAHPPVESLFIAEFTHTSTINDNDIAYLTLEYAPPIPPPHQ